MAPDNRLSQDHLARPKHSPGPTWTYCKDTRCGPCGNIYAGPNRYVGQAMGKAHAADLGFRPSVFADVEEQMANLRLMAASPFMFLVLQQIVGFRDDVSITQAKAVARQALRTALVGSLEMQ